MGVLIGRHEFEGPIKTFAEVPPVAGLYALLHQENELFQLIEVEQSDDLLQALTESYLSLQYRMIVFLPCLDRNLRNSICQELAKEFGFDDLDLKQIFLTEQEEKFNTRSTLVPF